jgi:tetratricopeptide (TPR) repeat protein
LAVAALAGGAFAAPPPAGAAPSAARAPAPQDPRARAQRAVELHDEARALYERGEYKKAIEKLEAALELDPKGKELVYNLALIHEKLLELDDAQRYYARYLEMEQDPKLRERALSTVKRIEGAKREKAERDEQAARDAARPPSAPAAPPPDASPRRRPGAAFWITVAAGSLALAAGTTLAITAVAGDPGADARTGDGVGVADLEADADGAHGRAVVADVAFVGAAALAGLAVFLFVTAPKERPAAARAADRGVRPAIGVRF